MVNDSPRVQAQGELQEIVDNSPRVQEQAQQQASVDNSPRQVAQRQQSVGIFGQPVQRQDSSEEEELQLQTAPVQRQGGLAEEELLQGKFDLIQPQGLKNEKLVQRRFAGSKAPIQCQDVEGGSENQTGMPNSLKGGLEQLSGMDLSGVRVHRNSAKPAQLNALAYAQGQDIHLGPGQEQYLSHEGWHVVQQMRGRVKPTMQAKGVEINDDRGLENEADVMGAKAVMYHASKSFKSEPIDTKLRSVFSNHSANIIQTRSVKFKDRVNTTRTITVENTSEGFKAFERKAEVGTLIYCEYEELTEAQKLLGDTKDIHKDYPHLPGINPVLNLTKLEAQNESGIGSLLMYEFAMKAREISHDLFIGNATGQGPAFYEKLGFRRVGNWLLLPTQVEKFPEKIQEALERLNENPIEHERSSGPATKQGGKESQGSAEMFSRSGTVVSNLENLVHKYWKIIPQLSKF